MLAGLLVGAAACFEAYDSPQALTVACAGCHGTVESKGAPPPGVFGTKTMPSDPGVGAHAAHQHPKRGASVSCETCHVVPSSALDPGHDDTALPAEVSFRGLALVAQHKPTWTSTTQTCTSVYCHDTDGATDSKPVWTSVQPLACSSCHGMPPARGRTGAHPPSTLAECRNCHPAVVNAAGEIIAPNRHVDGKVDFN